ncbi:MAG: hypothetical protein WA871_06335 [Candidatus Acidiferrales bacterium]
MARSPSQSPARGRFCAAIFACALAAAIVCGGCKRTKPAEEAPIDGATVPFSNADQLRPLNPTQYEVLQLAEVRQAGLSDSDCLELIQLARKTGQPFSDGDSIAELLGAGESKDTVLTLARKGQLGVFAGQVLAMHLARIPDAIILDVAQRRAAGETSLSGDMLAELLEAGYTQSQVTGLLDKGTTDAQAQQILDYRDRASAHGFVRNGRRRH